MTTTVKFYQDDGQDMNALLDGAEDAINAFLRDELPRGAHLQSVVPQFIRHDHAFVTILVTLTFDHDSAPDAAWMQLRLHRSR